MIYAHMKWDYDKEEEMDKYFRELKSSYEDIISNLKVENRELREENRKLNCLLGDKVDKIYKVFELLEEIVYE